MGWVSVLSGRRCLQPELTQLNFHMVYGWVQMIEQLRGLSLPNPACETKFEKFDEVSGRHRVKGCINFTSHIVAMTRKFSKTFKSGK